MFKNNRPFLLCSLFCLLILLGGCATATPEPTPTPIPATPAALATAVSTPTSPATATPAPPTVTPTLIPSPTPTPSFPIYDGPPLSRSHYGVQLHLHQENLAELMRHLTALNVGWVKVQVSWKLYQPEPTRYDDFRFGELDALVEAANEANIAVMLSVAKAPEWSRPTTEEDGPPTDFTLYRRFMQLLGERYAGRVAAYELWNEPNLNREWSGLTLSASELVRLIGEGATGVRTADPNALLISAAPAVTGINDGVVAIDDRVYLRQMLEAGVTELVDGIGIHPYGFANPPNSTNSNPDPSTFSHNNHPSFFFLDTINDYRALLTEFGSEQPLWVTEFGWGSFEGFDGTATADALYMDNVTEWQQAEYLLRAFEMAEERPFVGPMIVWNLNFGPLLGSEFSVSGYSLLRRDGSERPSYLALQAVQWTD